MLLLVSFLAQCKSYWKMTLLTKSSQVIELKLTVFSDAKDKFNKV